MKLQLIQPTPDETKPKGRIDPPYEREGEQNYRRESHMMQNWLSERKGAQIKTRNALAKPSNDQLVCFGGD